MLIVKQCILHRRITECHDNKFQVLGDKIDRAYTACLVPYHYIKAQFLSCSLVESCGVS